MGKNVVLSTVRYLNQEIQENSHKSAILTKDHTNTQATDKIDVSIDACGLRCPMPLLKAKQALNAMQSKQILELTATDSGSYKDFHAYTRQSEHTLLLAEEVEQDDGSIIYRYNIQKA